MNTEKLKASEIIRKQCCGNHYNELNGQSKLIAMVEKLESDRCIYFNALKAIQTLPSVREDESSCIASRAIKACE